MEACTIDSVQPSADEIERARRGDLGAFERLYRAHVRRIHTICLRLSGNGARAEELTQETFLRVWKGLDGLRPDGDLRAWLARIAVNVALGERRWRRRRPEREWDEPSQVDRVRARPGPDPVRGLDLEQAIANLPPRARAVFVLHDIEGHRHEEIARMLGVATGTTKAQLHRARRMLREALGR